MAKFLSEQDFIFHRIDGSSDSDNAIIKDTALILNQEWPNIKLQSRIEWLSRSSINNLPASWVLLNTNNKAIAHVRLSTKYKEEQSISNNNNNDNNVKKNLRENISVIATSVVVAKQLRGLGVGKILLKKMHECCFDLGFGRVVLWTTDAVGFYLKSGYKKIQPLKKNIPNVIAKHFSDTSLDNLRNVLMKKRKSINNNNNNNKTNQKIATSESVSEILDGDSNLENNTWLAFRVRSSFKPFYRNKKAMEEEMNHLLESGHFTNKQTNNDVDELKTTYINHVPFENQIGPMCGISALNCMKEYFKNIVKAKNLDINSIQVDKIIIKSKDADGNNIVMEKYKSNKSGWGKSCSTMSSSSLSSQQQQQQQQQPTSILKQAQKEKITTDGELFDIKKIGKLAAMDVCGLNSVVVERMSLRLIINLLLNRLPVLICYDRSSSSSIYGVSMKKGKAAHWALIVGFIPTKQMRDSNSHMLNTSNSDNNGKYKYVWLDEHKTNIQQHAIHYAFDVDCNDDINNDPILILQHGMSQKVLFCPWSKLKASNLQVEEYARTLSEDNSLRYKKLEWKHISKPTLKNCILFLYPTLSETLQKEKWSNVLDAYCKTNYYIDITSSQAINQVNVMINHELPKQLLVWLFTYTNSYRTEWFIATAFNPNSKPCDVATNLQENDVLEKYIIEKKWLYLKGIGQDPNMEWPGENHFLICATYMDAMEIMSRFHQNAVVVSSSAIVNDQMIQKLPNLHAKLLFNNGYIYPPHKEGDDKEARVEDILPPNNTRRRRRQRTRHEPLIENKRPINLVLIGGGVASISCIDTILDIANLNESNEASSIEIYLITPSQNIQRLKKKRRLSSYLKEYEIKYENAAILANKGVKVIQDTAKGLNMEEKQVLLESENIVSFDKLFIGTGALPNLLFRSPFCLSVRDKASVIDLGKRVSTSTHVVIVGNGAIAMEMVEALRGTPIDITWVVKDSYVGNTFFDQSASAFFQSKIFENRRRSDCHEYAIPPSNANHLQWQILSHDDVKNKADDKQMLVDEDELNSTINIENNVLFGHSLGPSWLNVLNQNIKDNKVDKNDNNFTDDDKNNAGMENSISSLPKLNVVYNATIAKYADTSMDDTNEWNLHICLGNGSIYCCDYLISATGVLPNTHFIRSSNVNDNIYFAEDGGIPVKSNSMQTFFSNDVYAAGDCCTIVVEREEEEEDSNHWFQMRLWDQAMYTGQKAGISMMSFENKFYDSLNFELFTHVTEAFGYKVVLLGRYNGQGMSEEYINALQSISLEAIESSSPSSLNLNKYKSTAMSTLKNDNDVEIFLRCTPGTEYIKVVAVNNKVCGAILIGETDLEETFENLILSQINIKDMDLLDPNIDLEDYFD